jgi:enoyl-CoA hydratase/carnithine racemase
VSAPRPGPVTIPGDDCLRVSLADGVAWVTIDHPPVNLLDARLLEALQRLSHVLAEDDRIRAIVFDSADPDFFIAHADVDGLIGRGDPDAVKRERLGRFAAMTERFRTMPKATIALIEGRARGGGSEFVLALDMRFAARGKAIFCQPEVALGIPPGGGATQRLHQLAGRGRALEAILGCEDFDADLAERYGWVNRALPADEVRPFVERLARRIAAFPAPAVAHAKAALDSALPSPVDGLLEEHRRLRLALATPEATEAMRAFLRAGGQTRDRELELAATLGEAAPREVREPAP